MPSPSPLGLYVHVPFCASICGYCNFNRGLFDPALKAAYVEAVRLEIRRAGDGAAADTIYFGGGTPSLLEPTEIGAIIQECRAAFEVAPGAEITLEANPETVSRASLLAFREQGVNRISFGVQSFRDEELQRLGRAHSAERARRAVAAARAAGFDNLSLDLMLWLPGQTRAHLEESLDGLLALGPEHASVYLLELYPNAPLRDTMARAGWSQAPDDDAADMYLMAMERLEEGGLEQYEISNLAAPGRRCRHNMKYWTDGEWAGFGPGAHSTRHRVRWNNVCGTSEYTRRVEAGEPIVAACRPLGTREALEEALFMGLRLSEGVPYEEIGARYGVDVWTTYSERLAPAIDAGLLIRQAGRLRLTRPGMLMANEVMAAFLRTDSTVE